MNVRHRLVGYRKSDDELADEHDLPGDVLDLAKRLAAVPKDDPDAAFCYPLRPGAVRKLAAAIAATIDTDANSYFLEGFADSGAPMRPGSGVRVSEAIAL